MICPTCKRAFAAPDPQSARDLPRKSPSEGPSDPPRASPAGQSPSALTRLGARATLPFCSARCRAADLGNWLAGAYRLATPASDEEPDSGPDTGGDPAPSN